MSLLEIPSDELDADLELPRPVSAASSHSSSAEKAQTPNMKKSRQSFEESYPNVRIGDPYELIELLKARSAAIIVGAGVSVALAAGPNKKLVTWRGFLDRLAETVAHLQQLPQSWLDHIRTHLTKTSGSSSHAPDLQVAAELIAEKCSAKDPFMRYNHLVFKILHQLRAEENSVLARSLDILGRVGDSPIMTTNYDVLLEDATGRFTLSIDDLLKAQRWHRVDPKQHPNPLDHHDQYVFHLHGLFYDDPDKKFVLTQREYAVTIDDFTIALKPVLIDAESGSISGAPIVRSSIAVPNGNSAPSFSSSVPHPIVEHPTPPPRPRSRISVYSVNDSGNVTEDSSPVLQTGQMFNSPKMRGTMPNPHQHDHPRSRTNRQSGPRSSSVGPGYGSPTLKYNDGERPEVLNLNATVPRREKSVGGVNGSVAMFPELPPSAAPSKLRAEEPESEDEYVPGVGVGPTVAFHRSMIFCGVGGTLQDVHFTSLFAALQEHNVFLHHNGLNRIKHYVLVKESELDTVMDFVFLDSLGREVPAKELLVAILYGRNYDKLPSFLAELAQRLQDETAAEEDPDQTLCPDLRSELRLNEGKQHSAVPVSLGAEYYNRDGTPPQHLPQCSDYAS